MLIGEISFVGKSLLLLSCLFRVVGREEEVGKKVYDIKKRHVNFVKKI